MVHEIDYTKTHGIKSSFVPINIRIQPKGGMMRKHTANQNQNDLPRLRATKAPPKACRKYKNTTKMIIQVSLSIVFKFFLAISCKL